MRRQHLTGDTAQKQRSEFRTKNVYFENNLHKCDNGTQIRGLTLKNSVNSKYKVKKKNYKSQDVRILKTIRKK